MCLPCCLFVVFRVGALVEGESCGARREKAYGGAIGGVRRSAGIFIVILSQLSSVHIIRRGTCSVEIGFLA
jgi:hypothetical protein